MDETPITQDQRSLNAIYDKWMFDPLQAAFYGDSDYYNYGYTTPQTRSQREASENLIEKLLAFIPEKKGTLLDVACGKGASTRQLLNYYAPSDLTGINISEQQLERARENAPGCRFLRMDAAHLDFPDASFDNILCVESAFHFETREQFLREALRVLKPDGRLVLSDILGWQGKSKKANYLPDPSAYRLLLSRVGFQNYDVIDATEQCSRACGRRLRRWPVEEYRAGRLGFGAFIRAWSAANAYALFMRLSQRYYLLVSAQKPRNNTADSIR
jgi:MPBQ/MSBQ methyltransferase